jgi:hypothetical protein
VYIIEIILKLNFNIFIGGFLFLKLSNFKNDILCNVFDEVG